MKIDLVHNELVMWAVCEAIGSQGELIDKMKREEIDGEIIDDIKFIVNGIELNFETVITRIDECIDEMVEKEAKNLISENFDDLQDTIEDFKTRVLCEKHKFKYKEKKINLNWSIINKRGIIIKCKDVNETDLFLKACEEEEINWFSGLRPTQSSKCYREFSTNEGRYITEKHEGIITFNFRDVLL